MKVLAVLALALFPAQLHAQPGAKCRALAGEIAALQAAASSLSNKNQKPFPNFQEKAAIAGEVKELLAQISKKKSQLTQCYASPSTSGGESFSMQGGVELTPAQVAAAVAVSVQNCPAPSPPKILLPLPPVVPNQSPAPIRSWYAASCVKGNPSDAQIAVSSSHVVVTFENSLVWYTKDGTKKGELTSLGLFGKLLATLATKTGAAGTCSIPKGVTCAQMQSDFRVLFDEYRKRFWVVDGAGIYGPNGELAQRRGIFFVGVSKGEDPASGWYLYWFDSTAHWGKANDKIFQTGDGADYPAIGIDPEAFSVTNIVATATNDYKYEHFAYFKAADGITGVPPSGWHYYDLRNPDGSPTSLIQPAVHHGSAGRAYYASRYQSDRVLVWVLTDPFSARHLERREVTIVDGNGKSIPFNEPQDAPQKGGGVSRIKMTNLGTDILKAVYRLGTLHLVCTDSQEWFTPNEFLTSIRLIRLFVAGTNVQTVGEPSYINRRFGKNSPGDSPQDKMYYGWPAIEVNKKGDMAIVYARSGVTIFPEVRYSTYINGESDIRHSRLLQAGGSTIGAGCVVAGKETCIHRWADTAGAALDPEDGLGIWMAQQYANASGRWDMWVGKVFGK